MNWQKILWPALVLLALIQLALLSAKLTGTVQWAWHWVLAPIWVPVVALMIIIVIVVALLGRDSANGENPFQ